MGIPLAVITVTVPSASLMLFGQVPRPGVGICLNEDLCHARFVYFDRRIGWRIVDGMPQVRYSIVPGQQIPMECDNGRHHHETPGRANLGCLVVDYDYKHIHGYDEVGCM